MLPLQTNNPGRGWPDPARTHTAATARLQVQELPGATEAGEDYIPQERELIAQEPPTAAAAGEVHAQRIAYPYQPQVRSTRNALHIPISRR